MHKPDRMRSAGASTTATDRRQEQLMHQWQGLVRSEAWKMKQKLPGYVVLDDLISDGTVGLVEAARRFDPSRGNKFSTFAYRRIRGAIFDGLRKHTWFRASDYHGSRYEHLANETLDVTDSDADPNDSATSNARWLKSAATTLSVGVLLIGTWSEAEHLTETDEDQSPEASATMKEAQRHLKRLVAELPHDARTIIQCHYVEGRPLAVAAERLGIGRPWVTRVHQRTLLRLANAMRRLGFDNAKGVSS